MNSVIVSSQSLDVLRGIYAPGETVMANLEVDDFSPSRLAFENEQGNKLSIGMLYFKKSEGKYHVFFNLPMGIAEGNYSLSYRDAKLVSGVQTYTNFSDNLGIIKSPVAISLKPTIFKLDSSKTSIKIELSNKGESATTINITSDNPLVKPVRESLDIGAGETKNLFVNYGGVVSASLLGLYYGDKVYMVELLADDKPVEIRAEPLSEGLEFVDATPIYHSIMPSQVIAGELEFRNINSRPLHNVTFHTSPSIADIIDFNTSIFIEIKPNVVYRQFIWINKNKNLPLGNYYGVLLMKSSEGAKAELGINILIREQELVELPVEKPEEGIKEELVDTTQPSLDITSITDITNVSSTGGITLVEGKVEKKTNSNRLIGIILLLIVLIAGSVITWRLRPKDRVIKFNDYISSLGKGQKKKN
ncbi:MAG: hypothetical protein V1906_00755 [Candidatus Woesearchaeota archaeon]